MREIEAWHSFLETLSSWLALQDEAYVNEIRLCVGVKDEIRQDLLPPDTAARSAKLFYLLSQSLAKWERGLELLRSCSKRQSMSATGYEAVRTLHLNYSIVSRMEAVYVRDGCMKLHAQCSGLKKPMDIIRHLEDEIAKAEIKLSNFPELKLSEADRCSILLQAVSHPARQYVALHGNANSWSELTKSLKYFEEQLRMCDVPTAANRGMDGKLCDHCGKHDHVAKDCWSRQREAGEKGGKGGKGGQGESKSGKGTGGPKGQRSPTPKGTPRSPTPKGKPTSKGEKGEKGERGKDKGKKKKNRARAMGEPESEAEASPTQTVMAMRFAQQGPELSLSESHERRVGFSLDKQRLGPVSNSLTAGDVERICASFQLEPRDVWLVDSGATCHVVSSEHLSGFRVVRKHEREVTLYNASGGKIPVSDVVDLEVVFGDCSLLLTEVLVAEVTFNAISPWAAVEKGWRTYLYKTGSRLYKGKRNVKLVSANRAWWALSGGRRQKAGKGRSPRQPSGSDMEIDAITCLQDSVVKPQPGPSILKKATTGGKKAEVEKPQGRESGDCRHALLETPFAFLLRGLRAEVSPKVVPEVPQDYPASTLSVPEVHRAYPETPRKCPKVPRKCPEMAQKSLGKSCWHILAWFLAWLVACFAVCWHESFVFEEGRIGACGAQLCFGGWKNDALGARAKKSKEEMFYHVFQGSQALTQGSAGMFDMLSCACAGHDVPRTLKHGTCACVWHDESLPLLVAGSRSGSNHGPGTLAWLDLICLGWSGQETSKIADLCRPFGNLATEGVEGIRPLSLLPKPSGETPAAGIRLLSLLPKPSGETPAAGIRPLSLLPKPSGETPAAGIRPLSLLPKPSGETPATGIRPLSLLPKPSRETPAGIRPLSLLPKPSRETPAGIRPLSLLPKPSRERTAGIRPLSLLPKPSGERPAGIRPLKLATARPGTCSFPVKFIGVVIDFAMVFLILIFSALVGVVVSGLWKLLEKCFQRGSKRAPEMSKIKPRKGGCWIRIRTRKCFKRVCVERILLVGRKSPKAPTKGKPKTLKLLACLRRVWHVLAWCLDVACFVLKGNDERVPEGGLKQPVTGHLRMLRGLPLPGSGTGSDPLILDRDDVESSSSLNQPNRSPQNPEQPPEAPIPQGEEIEERIPFRGHFPYDVNCESCCSSKGKVPARRLKRQLQKENQTIGVDFYYFGKLRVLLLVHVASRYSMSIPAMELHDPNLLFNIDRFIREIGLHQKTLTFRCDNEQGLISMCERVAAQRRENPTIVDVVPGYRPQSKGAVERQVSAMKQGFWSIWLDLEAVNKASTTC